MKYHFYVNLKWFVKSLILTFFVTIFITLFSINPLDIHCECTDLVIWGSNISSTVGHPRFGPIVSSMVSLTPIIKGIIVGLVLG